MHNKNGSQRLVGEVQMFRIRIATAESKLKVLRQQARQAKRRRKMAKRTAQRARKQFKRFKADLTELKQSLAKAETKLFRAGGRALAKKLAKARPVVNRAARSPRKSTAPVRKPTPTAPGAARTPRKVVRKEPATRKTNSLPQIPADVAAFGHTTPALQIPKPNQ